MSALVLPYRGIRPRISPAAWLAPNATVVGDVEIAAGVNLWFGVIVRADVAPLSIGENTNLQDGTVVHVSRRPPPTRIGANVTIGHMALIHACTLEDGCFVGMKACICDGAVVETGAMVAAGAVVPPNKRIPAGQLWAGNPARYLRDLTPEERAYIESLPADYVALAREYAAGEGVR
jgi:carbonic anhydrase/acetyltransferase-like protein (isoleucine patch superfamily)